MGHQRLQLRYIVLNFRFVSGVSIRPKFLKCLQSGAFIGIFILNKRPQIFKRRLIRIANTAGGAGFNSHVAQGHAGIHAHGRDHRPAKFNNLIGGAVNAQPADDRQDNVFGKHPGRQCAGNIDSDGLRRMEGANPF